MDKQLENTLRIVGDAWRETADAVEAMRARCEAIARALENSHDPANARKIADAIAALKEPP